MTERNELSPEMQRAVAERRVVVARWLDAKQVERTELTAKAERRKADIAAVRKMARETADYLGAHSILPNRSYTKRLSSGTQDRKIWAMEYSKHTTQDANPGNSGNVQTWTAESFMGLDVWGQIHIGYISCDQQMYRILSDEAVLFGPTNCRSVYASFDASHGTYAQDRYGELAKQLPRHDYLEGGDLTQAWRLCFAAGIAKLTPQ